MYNNIDWEFITELEGRAHTVGYHPSFYSGVTIASGFDLKEKDENFCTRIGIDSRVVNKLKPYFNLTGDQAAHFANTLVLSEEEVQHIDDCARDYYAAQLSYQYNIHYDPIVDFDNLDQGQATVLISVGFQYGGYIRTPKFIRYAADGKWNMVLEELRNFGDDYPTRRNKEADYLEYYGNF